MRRLTIASPVLIAISLFAAPPAAAGSLDGRWLHVRVDERGTEGENVHVNVPLQFVEAVLPTIDAEGLSHGKISLDEADLDGIDLRALLNAVRDAPDAEFVTVRSPEESVRVAKEKGFLLVNLDETDGEQVRVRVPIQVVEAVLAGGSEELDVLAALRALADYRGADLVTVESNDTSIRVWIDSSETGEDPPTPRAGSLP